MAILCCCVQQGVELEVEQLGRELVPIRDASVSGSGYTTDTGPKFAFFELFLQMESHVLF